MTRSRAFLTVKFALVDVVGSFLYFPVWWYTSGTLRSARFCAGRVTGAARSLGFSVWLKNLFVPMFGQRDFVSRIISFWLRLTTVAAYTVLLLLLSVLMLLLFAVWLVLPAFVLLEIGVHLTGLLA